MTESNIAQTLWQEISHPTSLWEKTKKDNAISWDIWCQLQKSNHFLEPATRVIRNHSVFSLQIHRFMFLLGNKGDKNRKKCSLADVKKKENENIVYEQFQVKERMERRSQFPLRLYEPTPATFVMGFDVGLRFVVNWVVAYNFDFSRVLPRYKNCHNLKQLFCNCSL